MNILWHVINKNERLCHWISLVSNLFGAVGDFSPLSVADI